MTRDASLKDNLTVAFMTEENECEAELKDVLYAPDLGYNLFSPCAEYDGESRDRLGGLDDIMTA